jgi:hypothetical protein
MNGWKDVYYKRWQITSKANVVDGSKKRKRPVAMSRSEDSSAISRTVEESELIRECPFAQVGKLFG